MQTIKIFLVYLLTVTIVACQSGSAEQPLRANVDMAIEGMVCAIGCAKTIEEKVSEMSGILSCKVNFEEANAHIEFDRNVLTGLDIQQAIEKMNDGQYKVQILHEETEEKADPTASGSEDKHAANPVSVSERSFSFPHLLTYFMKDCL